MAIHEISFLSANGKTEIRAWHYTPMGTPKGVVQLVHGYNEHSRRYLHMIDAFQQAGYAVFADDHLGNGKTGYDSGTLGEPHSGGFMTYLQDEKQLHDLAIAAYPDLPFCMFGHSWGSMLARGYAALYGQDMKALMLCGVCSRWPGWEALAEDDALRRAAEEDPDQPGATWSAKLFYGMNDRIPHPCNPSAWVAVNQNVVADHAADPYNAKGNTLEAVYDFLQLYRFIENSQWAEKLPKRLPVYLIAGDQDPCGYYGEGVYHVANLLAENGNPVTTRVYPGYRHEIHNEPELRGEVEQGLIAFLNAALFPENK